MIASDHDGAGGTEVVPSAAAALLALRGGGTAPVAEVAPPPTADASEAEANNEAPAPPLPPRVLRHKRPSWVPLPAAAPAAPEPRGIMSRPGSQSASRPASRVKIGGPVGPSTGTLTALGGGGLQQDSVDSAEAADESLAPAGPPFPLGSDPATINYLFPAYLQGPSILVMQVRPLARLEMRR